MSDDGRRFVLAGSTNELRLVDFTYDHDRGNRLLKTYWKADWRSVEEDFAEMKELGANTVRIHLQVSACMKSATKTNPESLAQLARLLALAEKTGLYLDVTGPGLLRQEGRAEVVQPAERTATLGRASLFLGNNCRKARWGAPLTFRHAGVTRGVLP